MPRSRCRCNGDARWALRMPASPPKSSSTNWRAAAGPIRRLPARAARGASAPCRGAVWSPTRPAGRPARAARRVRSRPWRGAARILQHHRGPGETRSADCRWQFHGRPRGVRAGLRVAVNPGMRSGHRWKAASVSAPERRAGAARSPMTGKVVQSNFHDSLHHALRINQMPPDRGATSCPPPRSPPCVGDLAARRWPRRWSMRFAASGKRIRRLPIGDQLKAREGAQWTKFDTLKCRSAHEAGWRTASGMLSRWCAPGVRRHARPLLALREDGRAVGSVSGGCIETTSWRDCAAKACRCGRSACATAWAEEARRFGPFCGGTMELVLELLASPAPPR